MSGTKPTSLLRRLFSPRILISSLLFGSAAAALIWAEVQIPANGSAIFLDPREIFVTLGSALCGPVGAVIIGVLASLINPIKALLWISMMRHLAGAMWIALSYKWLSRKAVSPPVFFLAWAGLIMVYYYGLMGPVALMLYQFQPELARQTFENGTPGCTGLLRVMASLLPEAIITTLTTTAVMAILPEKIRRPFW